MKKVVDWEEAWGLFEDGWAMSEGDDHQRCLPLWPAREFAAACAGDSWARYPPEPIALAALMEEWLPNLERDGVLPGVFFTVEQGSVEVSCRRLLEDLQQELLRYQ